MFYLRKVCSTDGKSSAEMGREESLHDGQANSSQEKKRAKEMSDWKYGIYTTYNIHDKKWYAFNREDSSKYWNGEQCLKGSGSTANEALNDYGKQVKES